MDRAPAVAWAAALKKHAPNAGRPLVARRLDSGRPSPNIPGGVRLPRGAFPERDIFERDTVSTNGKCPELW